MSWVRALHLFPLPAGMYDIAACFAALIGISGVFASAFIYLVRARPAWNMAHTPLDFLLSAAVLGSTLAPLLSRAASLITEHIRLPFTTAVFPAWPVACASVLWLLNQMIRVLRLHRAELFERRAAASLLNTPRLRILLVSSFVLAAGSCVLAFNEQWGLSFGAAFGGVLLARYLFFVSVVPLNMALTFVRGGEQ